MIVKFAIKACYLLIFLSFSVGIKAQLKADFSSSSFNGCTPQLIQFTDNSTGNPTQWKWDLGNGTISFLQNPSVTYFTPGLYTITLTIKNAAGTIETAKKINYINIYAKPVVDFNSNTTSGCYPLSVNFSDESIAGSGSITNWEWDFGDGTGATEQNPIHIYTYTGNYNVSLRVTNTLGCTTTFSKMNFININDGIKANFTNNTPSACSFPVKIDFQNITNGTGNLTYTWDFGDGNTSTNTAPSHTYNLMGSYTVKLIATNASGCADTMIKKNGILVGNFKADFNTPNTVCNNKPINITNTSVGTPTSVTWFFGDGTTSNEINPTKLYFNEGVYNIKLVENFGGCFDSVKKDIQVLPSPKAMFSADKTSSCKPPLNVTFKNESIAGSNYKWLFGDGSSSTEDNPTHTYLTNGKFDVSLIINNLSGCSDTIKKSSFIQISMPKLTLLNLPDSSCKFFTKSFSYAAQEIDIWSNQQWDFGDGTTASGATPTHTYNNEGSYTVKLIATTIDGCVDTAIITNAIKISSKITPTFIADRLSCASEPISFTDNTIGSPSKWLWNFGDNSQSNEHNPIHQYSDTGYFSICLTVWNGGCRSTTKYVNYVYINAPIAKFETIGNCVDVFKRNFIDESIGADSWKWDFGDAQKSTEQNPVHTYSNIGTYTVSLTVHNNETGCNFTTTHQVIIMNAKADFSVDNQNPCRNSIVNFSAPQDIRPYILSYVWSFGDGITTTTLGGETTHSYSATGTDNVTLITKNIIGCIDTMTKPLYINIEGPTAKLIPSIMSACSKTNIIFNDSSISDGVHKIEKWVWQYGDGNIDTTFSNSLASHTYTTGGQYIASLKTIDSRNCSDTYTMSLPILILQPLASFFSNDTLSCPTKSIQFTNESVGSNLLYNWNFGDSTNQNIASPNHQYSNDGKFEIKLLVTDKFGCMDSVLKLNYINILTPHANFNMSDSLSTCPPLVVRFTNLSANYISLKWDFGDNTFSTLNNPSHFYNYPGIYVVKLTITSAGGCIDIKEKVIQIKGPRGTLSYTPLEGCKDLKIDFLGTNLDKASFIWDFNDGTAISTNDSVISHTYTHFGEYLPKLILVDKGGCQVPIVGKDTIKVSGATAKFSFVNKVLCDSGMVAFTDSSTSYDQIISYSWDMGDGNIYTSKNATHHYTTVGQFFPKLLVTTSFGCASTYTSPDAIKIVSSPKATITDFTNGCVPLSTGFKGSLLAPDTSTIQWKWDFGNGNSSTLQNPLKELYTIANMYTIQLTATNSSGCFDTVIRKVEAYPIPTVNAGADTWVCLGKNYQLKATGAETYQWNYNTTLSSLNTANPVATPIDETRYIVTGTSIHGCVAKDEVTLHVQKPFKIKTSATDTLCKGTSTQIYASGASTYIWQPSLGLKTPTSDKTIAQPDTTTVYKVIGTDDKGCFNDTGYVKIKVYPIPTVVAGENKTVNIGKSITLTPTFSSDVTDIVWMPKTGIISTVNSMPNITVKPVETTQYTIEVKNPGGCKASDNVTVFVICNGANIFMPNTFSPNGDGANDVYYPRGTGLFKIKDLKIFNRWGEIVFEKNNFNANDANAAWDGTYKGVKLNPDVFVYMLDIICDNNENLTFKGNIALIQ